MDDFTGGMTMEMTRTNRMIASALPSLTDVMFLLPVVFLLGHPDGLSGLIEGDTGYHLRAGEWMIANRAVPFTDMFSYTKPGEPWFAWEWLWDVGAAALHMRFGMPAVVLMSLLVLCITSVILYRMVLRQCGHRLPAAVFTFLAVGASSLHWWARPHIFSWLFILVTLWVLERKQNGEANLLWTLPVLTLVWVNIHGGFIAALLLLACYGAGALLQAAFGQMERLRFARDYGLTMAACLAASMANPYGYRLHLHVANYFANPESPIFRQVGEWQSISFQPAMARFTEILIVSALFGAFFHASQKRFHYVFLVLGWLHLGLISGRNIPIFALVAAPCTAQAAVEIARRLRVPAIPGWLSTTIEKLRAADMEFSMMDRLPRIHLASIFVILFLASAVVRGTGVGRLHAAFPADRYPVKAMQQLPAGSLAGRVFTDDEWGDYLIYSRYPEQKVFIDGRFDFYGAGLTQEYLDIRDGKHDWEKRLRKHGVDAVLLPVASHLSSTLKESGRWIPVYDDGVAILFHTRERQARRGVPHEPGSQTDPGKPGAREATPHMARQFQTPERSK
jgi:hypothetical protein